MQGDATQDLTQPQASAKAMSPAALRMTRSRIALRQVLQQGAEIEEGSSAPQGAGEHFFSALLGLLKNQSSAQLALQAIQTLWQKNPWMIIGKNALEASSIVLTPIAKRSPVKLVFGAFLVGAVVCAVRPWRLVKKSALIASLFAR